MASVQSPNPTKERLLRQDSSSDNIGTAKPEADNQEANRQGPAGAVQGQRPLRRYWIRALVAIAIPTIITVYYGIIWVLLVQGTTIDEAVKYNTYSGSLIFYSWFIIGVFALSWAKFGLVGVEASMLHTRFWHAPSLAVLLMHADSTWSSPSGWLKAIKHREFHRLWMLLTFVSILPFIAMPLSGLVFEITDGYISTSEIPLVQGRNQKTFNQKYERTTVNTRESAWLLGYAPSIPGIGIIYTDESVDRSEHDDFGKLPNTLPVTESIPDLFLPPQADKPVSGRTWGLRIKYDCSVVRSASEFTILSQKHASSIKSVCNEEFDGVKCIRLQTPSGDEISLWNATDLSAREPINVGAYFEVGASPDTVNNAYDGNHPDFEAVEGDTSLVLEYAVWQHRYNGSYGEEGLHFNETVGSTIEGIGSPFIQSDGNTYTLNHTFFALKGDKIEGGTYPNRTTDASELMDLESIVDGSGRAILFMAPPIGVRCVASSGLGTAELDGVTSTFRDFQRVNPDKTESDAVNGGSPRFGYSAADIVKGRFYDHYVAGGLPGLEGSSNSNRLPGVINSDGLLRSVNLAYVVDGFDLIYSLTSSFKAPWPEPGLTTSREGRILAIASLIPGSAMGYTVLALFCLWAALSVGLSLWYGFQLRPSDRLDGYTMLWKGVEMADDLKDNEELVNRKSFHGSKALAALPGR